MNPADNLLQRLHGVRRIGPGKWLARCPAHEDRHPSLSLREADDGRLLLKCWAGCSAHDVVGALGLNLADLFPPRAALPGAGAPPVRRPWLAADLLHLAAFEATVASVAARAVACGNDDELHRLLVAARRLGDMAEAVR